MPLRYPRSVPHRLHKIFSSARCSAERSSVDTSVPVPGLYILQRSAHLRTALKLKVFHERMCFCFYLSYEISCFKICHLSVKLYAAAIFSWATPSNPHIKSRCQNFLRNSPSVIAWKPAAFCFATISVTHSSVMRSSSSCVMVPSSKAFFAVFNFSGLKNFLQNHNEMVSLMCSFIR